jgi:hypothetical protein
MSLGMWQRNVATEHAAYQTHRDTSGDEGGAIWEMMTGG